LRACRSRPRFPGEAQNYMNLRHAALLMLLLALGVEPTAAAESQPALGVRLTMDTVTRRAAIAEAAAGDVAEAAGATPLNEARVKSECSDYRIVHFATLALLDGQKPMYSGVVFSLDSTGDEDGFLQTQEIFNLRLNVDPVVLSACQTGLGKLTEGEGMVGLSRAFMYAGAPSLVASLWSVNDMSTALLMNRFYTCLNQSME